MKLITANLINELTHLTEDAIHICWITAFAMKSGVSLILPTLKKAHDRGCEIQLLVGDYLYITQPEALKILLENLPNAEIRMYRSYGKSFHPKAYLFRHQTSQHVIVGSSNLSQSALTSGVEWNLYTVNLETFEKSVEEFHRLFYSIHTIPINKETLKEYEISFSEANKITPLSTKWDDYESTKLMYGVEQSSPVVTEETDSYDIIVPRPAQKLALDALDETIEQGYDKALTVLATGLGKTYLAAFFAKRFNRILFIAHRDEILQQAKKAFKQIHPNKSHGYFNAKEKDIKSEFIFASIFTISQKYHLNKFQKDDFDLIVIDEFHHAVAKTYSRVIDYFTPKFLLGITATPDRLDNQDVYSICDGNVAIQIHFLDAIARKWLSPFHYYGIKDEIDYSQIKWLGNHYDEEELLKEQLQNRVVEKVFNEWIKYKQTKTLAFCSSVKQAKYLCNYFKNKNIKAEVLTGQNSHLERKNIREKFTNGEIEIIFTVDLFNEGVDIPTVDTLLFIRPTESISIFTQQIGRGLRIAEGKTHCVIIDFIGNYRNVDRKLRVFKPTLKPNEPLRIRTVENIPMTDCTLNFDLEAINLLEEMVKRNRTYRQQIIDAYFNLKLELGRRPTYLEMYLKSNVYELNLSREFGSYIGMLYEADELSDSEINVFNRFKDLLHEIEKTAMSKSYKMVVLKSMLERGKQSWYKAITAEKVAPFFQKYLSVKKRNSIDPVDPDIKKVISLIERMPMKKWANSSKGFVTFENKQFQFEIEVPSSMEETLFQWVNEICEYRLHRYFERKAKKLKNKN
ncbi:DEAD/DEAH box helicase family protein [Fervidibacillus halotolerans]|uniref:DEAD/DEAH box helicase family protein n=1 Tax=Fervidibacillus halotolerans TaxID=2980027 RepID=A0A9E8M1V0_9BACI|nr:DEAD/DEAH box helicase family protein [Fervidibacillus halotolerans]WAA13355.1 DEAD/DEAH box helicase family protein [Fervidibacillus halotolerans]